MNEVDKTYDLSDGDLIEGWLQSKEDYNTARRTFFAFEGEVVRRMGENLSLTGDNGTVVRSPQLGPYQWDNVALRQLFGSRVPEMAWKEIEVQVTTTKTRTVSVNKWAKKLGISDAELAKCYFRAESKQDLEFFPNEPSMEPWEKSIEAIADHHLAGVE